MRRVHPALRPGLRCYPHPGSELPLQALVLGEGTCEKRRDAEYGASPEQVADNGDDAEGGLVENHVDGNVNLLGGTGGAGRKPLKSGMKELAVFREKVTEQHRQMGKGGKHHLGLEEPKKLRPPPARTPASRSWTRSWNGSPPCAFRMSGAPWSTCTPCTSPTVTSMACTTSNSARCL